MRVLIVATLLGSVGWPALLTPTSDMDNASPYNTSAGGDTYAPGDGLKLGTHPKIILLFWFSSLILAQAGLLLLLLTFSLSKSITPRDPALVNLTVISFIGTFIYLILFYDGSWMEHLPPFAPCLTQTVLKHSFDIAYLVAVLILIFEVQIFPSPIIFGLNKLYIQTWRSLLRLGNDSTTRVRGIRLYLIIALPYLSAVCVGVPVVVRATHHPTDIVRDDWSFYCTLNNPDMYWKGHTRRPDRSGGSRIDLPRADYTINFQLSSPASALVHSDDGSLSCPSSFYVYRLGGYSVGHSLSLNIAHKGLIGAGFSFLPDCSRNGQFYELAFLLWRLR
ncbi:hypothetical protein SISSUDRAFT_311484 [Sistotremastrum suecicum HHB10207 ss-3]|uniref:Uncharacterized protein n=1 Tax=Sistotremastrum suecicum HHB10207 ss-3 TaxID=1314776 RepID=A0A165ZCJ2_9AGAM|nr:hypothetical protein SISSUDRAFT_311484 [Sistotremastrum suecicum HHB10207 ss-3]